MFALALLVALALIALIIVSFINRAQEKENMRRLKQRKLKLHADALADVVSCLEHTIPSREIPKLINDEVIAILDQIWQMETGPKIHIETSIRHARIRSEDILAGKNFVIPSFQKDSDAQIAQTQLEINEAGKVLRQICAQGRISEAELERHLLELSWAYLMVSVASFIGQGYKFSALEDRFSAQGFYQKAQQLLMESLHPDPRRLRMIRELSEIIEGSRKTLSRDLLTERVAAD